MDTCPNRRNGLFDGPGRNVRNRRRAGLGSAIGRLGYDAASVGRRDDRGVVDSDLLDDRSATAWSVLARKVIEVGNHLRSELRVASLKPFA